MRPKDFGVAGGSHRSLPKKAAQLRFSRVSNQLINYEVIAGPEH
jgi:hypothetical protein